MIFTLIAGLGIICVLFIYIFGKKKYGDRFKDLDKKEYSLKDIMFVGAFVGNDILRNKHITMLPKRYRKIYDSYVQLYGRQETEKKIKLYYFNKLSFSMLVFFLVSLLGLFSGIQTLTTEQSIHNDTVIDRPEFGTGEIKTSYDVIIQDEETQTKKTEKIEIVVPEKEPTTQQIDQSVKTAIENVKQYALGDNETFDHITEKLYFYKADYKANLNVEWSVEDYSLINRKGEIIAIDLTEEGKKTDVTASFKYKDQIVGNYTFTVHIYPKVVEYTREEVVMDTFSQEIEDINNQKKHVSESKVQLPETVGDTGAKLNWENSSLNEVDYSGTIVMVVASFVLMVLIFFMMDEKVDKLVKERKELIQMEFPIFIDKFVLLLNCGNSVDLALKRSLNAAIEKNPERAKHPLYQELILTLTEIEELGISNIDAFERFGKRVRIPDVMKFASLVSQSIKKGDREISHSLSNLIKEAWEKKKVLAKERGSQASTKLLLPMMLMLLAVLILVIAPAAFTFMDM